jgi:hypothetical protein
MFSLFVVTLTAVSTHVFFASIGRLGVPEHLCIFKSYDHSSDDSIRHGGLCAGAETNVAIE